LTETVKGPDIGQCRHSGRHHATAAMQHAAAVDTPSGWTPASRASEFTLTTEA